MVALRALSCLARKTTCVYCGARLPDDLPRVNTHDAARDRAAREAARLACPRHLDVAMAELVHRRVMEDGDA